MLFVGLVLHGIAPASTWAYKTREEIQYLNADLSDTKEGVHFSNVGIAKPIPDPLSASLMHQMIYR